MGLIMMELAPSTPAAKAAAVPLGRLLTPWGSHRVAYDVNRLVTCAKRAVIIRIGNGQRRRTLGAVQEVLPVGRPVYVIDLSGLSRVSSPGYEGGLR